MKCLLFAGACLTLGLWAAPILAQEPAFRLRKPQPVPEPADTVRASAWRPATPETVRPAAFWTPAAGPAIAQTPRDLRLEQPVEPLVAPSPALQEASEFATLPRKEAISFQRAQASTPIAAPRLVPVPVTDSTAAAMPIPMPDAGPMVGPMPMEVFQAEPEGSIFFGEGGYAWLPGRYWVRGEALVWWTRGQDVPNLVTTSPPGTPLQDIGVIGPGKVSTVLFGGQQHPEQHPGFRVQGGVWLDDCQQWGIEGSFFYLGQSSRNFSAASAGDVGLARPFNVQNFQVPGSELVAVPGFVAGRIDVNLPAEFLGADINLRRPLRCGCDYRLDALAGYRFLSLRESLSVTENATAIANDPDGTFVAGDRFSLIDRFDTRNYFHGGQLGLVGEIRRGRWMLEGTAKLALGVSDQRVTVFGQVQADRVDGTRMVAPGGLLALPSNIGQFSQTHFTAVPELGVKLHYQISDHLRAFVGYNFLYMSGVVRPGDQIDQTLDIRQIPFFLGQAPNGIPDVAGVPRPQVTLKTTDFWAQGMSLGLEWRY